jgi:heme/copper-type cytochrome/quinol oxidase subunit 1
MILSGKVSLCRSGNNASTGEYSHAEQGLTATRGIPESQLVQFVRYERLKTMIRIGLIVVGFHLLIQPIQQLLGLLKYQSRYISVKSRDRYWKYFMLRTMPSSLLRRSVMVPVLDDVQVIAAKVLLAEPDPLQTGSASTREKARLSIFINTLVPVFTQAKLQSLARCHP